MPFYKMLKGFARPTLAMVALLATGPALASDTIVQVAKKTENLQTLVKALATAGLAASLEGEGPFTVFAPTDEAFAKMHPAKLKALLADRYSLTEVLTYHVVPGRFTVSQVSQMSRAQTAQGQSIDISVDDKVHVDNATVIAADIMVSNGVVHVIDEVMLPLGYSMSQEYDLMDPDVFMVSPGLLPPNVYQQLYGR